MKQLLIICLLLSSVVPQLRAEGGPPRPPKEEPSEPPKVSTGERMEIPDAGFSITPPNGWMVSRNSHGSSLLFEAPKQPNQSYLPTIQVMVFGKPRYVDEVTQKEYGDLIVEKFGKLSNRVTSYRLRSAEIVKMETGDPAILYYTEFQYDDVPIMQMHILISSATNHFLMSYTDVAKIFEDDGGPALGIAYASMHSAQVASQPPWRWRGFVLAGIGVFALIFGWFTMRFMRARKLSRLGQRIEDEDNKEITQDEESQYYSRHTGVSEVNADDGDWAGAKPKGKAAPSARKPESRVSQVASSHFDDDDEPEVSEVVPISTLEKSLHPGRKRREVASAPRQPGQPVSHAPVSQHGNQMPPQGMNQQMPQQAMNQMPPQAMNQMPPQGMNQQMPQGMNQQMPQGMNQQMPQGMNQQMPQQGMNQQMPPQGMNQQMPPQGMNQQMPPQGMNQQMPPQGMNQQMPPQGMNQQMPPQGMNQQMPPQGMNQQMPPQGMNQQMPPQAMNQMPPQAMNQMPPQGMNQQMPGVPQQQFAPQQGMNPHMPQGAPTPPGVPPQQFAQQPQGMHPQPNTAPMPAGMPQAPMPPQGMPQTQQPPVSSHGMQTTQQPFSQQPTSAPGMPPQYAQPQHPQSGMTPHPSQYPQRTEPQPGQSPYGQQPVSNPQGQPQHFANATPSKAHEAMANAAQFGQMQGTDPNYVPGQTVPVSEQPLYIPQAHNPAFTAPPPAAPVAPAQAFAPTPAPVAQTYAPPPQPTPPPAMPQFEPAEAPEQPVTASRQPLSTAKRQAQPRSQELDDDGPEMTEEARLSEILPKAGTIEKSKPKRKGLFWRKKTDDDDHDDDHDEVGEDNDSWKKEATKKSGLRKSKDGDDDDDGDSGDQWAVEPTKKSTPSKALAKDNEADEHDEHEESDAWAPEATKRSEPKKDSLLNETQGPHRLAKRPPQGPVTKEQNNAAVTEDGWNLNQEVASDHDEDDEEEVS